MRRRDYILGTITIVAIIGGTVYAIKKARDADKLEDEVITLDQAKYEVEHGGRIKHTEAPDPDRPIKNYNEVDVKTSRVMAAVDTPGTIEFSDDIREVADYNSSFGTSEDEEVLNDPLDFHEPGVPLKVEEGDELRFEPNSPEARRQFIEMELAEWEYESPMYATLERLTAFPFKPMNDGDQMLATKIIDYKSQFFGITSRWTKEVTFTDVILYFGRLADYNLGKGVYYWVEHFMDHNDLGDTHSSYDIDNILKSMNKHSYYNEGMDSFGLFGLDRFRMDLAIETAQQNIDNQVTYEIEFNEFLKEAMMY